MAIIRSPRACRILFHVAAYGVQLFCKIHRPEAELQLLWEPQCLDVYRSAPILLYFVVLYFLKLQLDIITFSRGYTLNSVITIVNEAQLLYMSNQDGRSGVSI